MGSSILIYFPCISKSITFPLQALVQKLIDRGHEVTFATSYILTKNPGVINVEVGAGIRNWAEETSSAHLFSGKDLNETNLFELSVETQRETLKRLMAMNKVWDTVIVYPAFGNEVNNNNQNKIIVDVIFLLHISIEMRLNGCKKVIQVGLYLARRMKANLALYITDMPTTAAWIDHAFGYYQQGGEAFRESAVQEAVWGVVKDAFPGEEALTGLSIEEIEKTAGAVLCQGNPLIMKGLRPVPPNLVYCGMMQCRPGKELPADLQQFMDSASEGVLLVSFGSVLQGSQVPQDKLAALLEAFGRLKEKVLFKWETDNLPGKPANVILKSFLPQQDLLAHPNLKGFVTHAGYLSFEEALCHQIPMVATPIFYDQFANAEEIEKLGIGQSVNFTDITGPKISELLDQVLHNPQYKAKAKQVGAALSPWKEMVGPVDRAVWWLEQITNNPGVYTMEDFYQKYPSPLA